MEILYLLLIFAILASIAIQIQVSNIFSKYSRVKTANARTGAQVARRILDAHGLFDVRIDRVPGNLTDHYDPRSRVLCLSENVYDKSSPSAAGVAAHEVGHAIQHAENYAPITMRTKLVPLVTFASKFSWIAILLGIIIMYASSVLGSYMFTLGIILFAATTLFHLVTLPCEFDASRRALTELELCGWYSKSELGMSQKVLKAAAMTYVAALAVSALQLLRLIGLLGDRR